MREHTKCSKLYELYLQESCNLSTSYKNFREKLLMKKMSIIRSFQTFIYEIGYVFKYFAVSIFLSLSIFLVVFFRKFSFFLGKEEILSVVVFLLHPFSNTELSVQIGEILESLSIML